MYVFFLYILVFDGVCSFLVLKIKLLIFLYVLSLSLFLILKMLKFSDNTFEVINYLTHDQLRVLFGNAEKFKNWLKNKEIEDIVSIN